MRQAQARFVVNFTLITQRQRDFPHIDNRVTPGYKGHLVRYIAKNVVAMALTLMFHLSSPLRNKPLETQVAYWMSVQWHRDYIRIYIDITTSTNTILSYPYLQKLLAFFIHNFEKYLSISHFVIIIPWYANFIMWFPCLYSHNRDGMAVTDGLTPICHQTT